LEPVAILLRSLFVLDVMAQLSRLRLHVAMLGGDQRLRIMGFGPLALVSTPLAETLQFVRVCPEGPAA
jgi:hypothetical protein